MGTRSSRFEWFTRQWNLPRPDPRVLDGGQVTYYQMVQADPGLANGGRFTRRQRRTARRLLQRFNKVSVGDMFGKKIPIPPKFACRWPGATLRLDDWDGRPRGRQGISSRKSGKKK